MALATAYSALRLFLDGMLSMMALYALLSYFQQRKAIYWQYALYVGCMVVDFRLSDIGYSLPGYQPGTYYPETIVESVAYMLYVRFAILLINPGPQDPLSLRLMKVLIWALVFALILDSVLLLAGTSVSVRSGVYMANRLAICALGLYLVPRIFRLRNAVVAYFISGSLWLMIGSVAALLLNYVPLSGIWAVFRFPVATLQIGVVGEVLFFTLGLSLSNWQNEREKIKYQAELIDQLRENERKQQKINRIRDDIAHDLHDDIGADLGSISLLSQVAGRQLATQPEQARHTLQTIGQTARRIVATMREIVWSLNSSQTSLESFSYRLSETAETLFEHQPTTLTLDLPVDDLAWVLPAEGRRDLFLLVKEMLYNVIRHAGATQVTVRMWVETDKLHLTVTDNGKGFAYQANKKFPGNGLASMQQRARALNGELSIASSPGHGTSLTFNCPLVEQEIPEQV